MYIGMVGGSNLDKQKAQIGDDGQSHAIHTLCSPNWIPYHATGDSNRFVRLHLPREWSGRLQGWSTVPQDGVEDVPQ